MVLNIKILKHHYSRGGPWKCQTVKGYKNRLNCGVKLSQDRLGCYLGFNIFSDYLYT